MTLSRRSFVVGASAVAALGLGVPAAAQAAGRGRPPAPAGTGSTGGFQSPIAIRSRDAVEAPGLPRLWVRYPREVEVGLRYVTRDDACSARGPEDVVQADVPAGAANLWLGTTRYELLQYHWHVPSEHVLDGRRFPAEQHFVHRGPDGETLVLAVLLVPGGHHPQVPVRLPEECGETLAVVDDLAAALPRTLSTFRFPGSLTSAPYTEPVSWLVLEQPRPVATAGLRALRRTFPQGDARPVQPLNGRLVQHRTQ